MPRYELSGKFWDIKLVGAAFTTNFGKLGSPGQTRIKEYASVAEAKAGYDAAIAGKLKEGYALAGAAKPAATKPAAARAAGAKPAAARAPAATEPAPPGARYFEYVEGSSSKFWEIALAGTSVATRYGKIGSGGQTTVKDFDSKTAAFKEYDKLVAEKTRKGYQEQAAAAGGGNGDARNPELEKAINADPADADAYSVLGDWLQDQGDPRGELIALQLAHKDKQALAAIANHQDYFLGPLADHQKTYDGEDTDAFTWRFGYIHAVRLSHDHYANEDWEGSLAEVLETLLRHPSGRFLAEITFVFNNDPNENDLQDLIDILAKHAPPTIRKLHFGDYDFCGAQYVGSKTATGNTEISWYAIGDLAKLWKRVPELRTLITQGGSGESTISGEGLKLGTIDLPNLTHAEFRTGGLDKANVKAIVHARLPKIERLDIWFGDDNYGGDATMKDVAPLLGRTDLPALRHLGLRNAVFTDDMIEPLAKSKLTRQLKVLDLSLGCLSDDGARAIVNHRDAFAHLERLDLEHNYLTDQGRAALKPLKNVAANHQRDFEDVEDRYPAVAE